jgi:hypothetical protein
MALIFPSPAQIKNLLGPTANTDAATKLYVDTAISTGSGNIGTGNITASGNISANGNITANNFIANYTITANGNITSANANLGNLVIANYFSGDGSLLTGITASGGNANYANFAGTVTTASQPNITSLGTLSGLTVSGNATITGNLVVAGNTLYVNSTTTSISDPIIELGAGANGGALISPDSFDRGTLLHYYTTTTVDAFIGWKSANSEFVLASNASVSNNIVTINTLGNIRVGNANLGNAVSANYFIGSGANLSAIAGANVTGQVGNANVAGTVYTNAQPNITSVGTLSNLSVTGNITSGNANLGNLVTSNYFAGVLTTNAQPNITSVGTLTSLTITGNVTSGNANLGNLVTANYFVGSGANLTSINGSNVTGQVGNALVASTVYTNAQPNITSVGTLVSLSVTGNITSVNASLGNLVTANYFSGSGNNLSNIQGSNVTGQIGNALVSGTVYTNAQPNITSVGTLSSLTVSGTTNLGAIGNITITGGSSGQIITTNGSGLLSFQNSSQLTSTVDSFIGDGANTTFTLSVTPTNVNYTLVSVQGVSQPRTAYSLSGKDLTFSSAPTDTSVIEVTTLGGSVSSSGITVVAVPAHNNSTGTVGQIAYDSSYLYVCVNTNTWVRSAIITSW